MKTMLRQKILRQRKDIPEAQRQERSQKILNVICNSSRYQKADTIFTFVSMDEEVNTYPLIERAWQDGKKVAVPIAKKGREMYFVHLGSFEELEQTRFGVMEPQKEEIEAVVPKMEDTFIVPGSVFDEKGNRYGYGGGYYDRYFQSYSDIFKIGVAFSFQVMDFELQVEQYDVPVDCVVTENGLIGGFNYEYFD